MFYTEYRPKKFTELLGAEHVTAAITGSLKKGNSAHAYFFTGGRGIGKTTTARLLAKALNCQNPITDTKHEHVHYEPCGKCPSCLAIQAGNHLDLIEIDAASNRGIDDIRALRENVALSATMGGKKIYIIDEVHMLTNEASNALLKTLEEPPVHVYFILCTTNPEKVLDTIKSRCIQINFKKPDINILTEKLKLIAKDKQFVVDDSDLQKIALLAKGAYREAETYLEQLINGEKDISHLLIYSDGFATLTNFLKDKNITQSIQFVNELYKNGTNIEIWTEKYIEYLRALLFVKVGVNDEMGTMLTDEDRALTKGLSVGFLKDALKRFLQATTEFKISPFPTIPVEIALIDLQIASDIGLVENIKPVQTPETPKVVKPIKEVKVETKAPEVEIVEKVIIPEPAPKESLKKFPYKSLVESLKDSNHSIYLLLSSCKLASFDGESLVISAGYSFHKERVLSTKIRTVIEEAAKAIAGNKVIIKCELSSENPDAKELTDNNITEVKKPQLEDVFYNVFGSELEEVTDQS